MIILHVDTKTDLTNFLSLLSLISSACEMDEIILNMETLMTQFQCKFVELETLLRDTNREFSRLKTEYVKCVPIAEGSVMTMKDFVSYMSALEELDTENDETSQNISELPLDTLDNEDVIKSESEETSSAVKSGERRQRKHSRTNSFGLQGVILEEEEGEEEMENEEKSEEKVKDEDEKMESDPVPSVRSSLARPCSIPRPTTLSKTSTIKTLNSLNTQPLSSQSLPSQPKTENNNNVKSVSLLQPACRKPTNLDLVNIRQVSSHLCKDFLHKTCVQSQTQPRHSPHSAAPGAGSLGLRQSVSDDSVGRQNPET